jgi:hypothetical protein
MLKNRIEALERRRPARTDSVWCVLVAGGQRQIPDVCADVLLARWQIEHPGQFPIVECTDVAGRCLACGARHPEEQPDDDDDVRPLQERVEELERRYASGGCDFDALAESLVCLGVIWSGKRWIGAEGNARAQRLAELLNQNQERRNV